MVKRAEKGKLVEAADGSAARHLDAARRLSAASLDDLAAFHLLTALEEVVKGRMEEVGLMGLFRGTKWEGQAMTGRLDRARHLHSVKIPFGVLILTFDGTMLATLDVELQGNPTEPDAGAKARRPVYETVMWFMDLLEKHPNLREEAIYSGPGPDGLLPLPVDWKEFVSRMLPLLERVVEFQAKAHIAAPSPEEVKSLREQVVKMASGPLAELDSLDRKA